ncbi:MAG: hypothetical protein ACJAZR_002495, partial [Sediminicola sp.]
MALGGHCNPKFGKWYFIVFLNGLGRSCPIRKKGFAFFGLYQA